MDLLGIRRLNPRRTGYGFMFRSLIRNILWAGLPHNDFGVKLTYHLEKIFAQKVQDTVSGVSGSTTNVIREEIQRVEALTELLALRIGDVYDFEILDNGLKDHEKYPNGGTEKQRIEAFEDDVKKNEPFRTFDFNTKDLLEG